MSEELKQAEPKKMGWFRKYVLMQDLRETNEFMVNFFVILYMGATLFGSFALVIMRFGDDIQLNFNELTTAKAQLHSYVYYNKKSKSTDGRWYIELNNNRIDYYINFHNIDKDVANQILQTNGESIEIQYIPSQNKFYLIKFNNPKFAVLPEAKITLSVLKQNQYNNLHKLPLYSFFSTLFFIIIEMLILRYEVFGKLETYFTVQPWNIAKPLIFKNGFRGLFILSLGLFLMLINVLIIADNFIWR